MNKEEILIDLLEKRGYIDGVDCSIEISLFEYGFIRNPKTNNCILCLNCYDDKYIFQWTDISIEDIKEAIEDIEKGFYDFVGIKKEDYLENISNDNLAIYFSDINMYNGSLTDYIWYDEKSYSIDEIIEFLKGV